jgi:hypothetical protein
MRQPRQTKTHCAQQVSMPGSSSISRLGAQKDC